MLPAFLAGPELSERFIWRNCSCFTNTFCELLNWLCPFLFACGSSNLVSSFNLVKGVWSDVCFICSRTCNCNRHCHCWGTSFQVMVAWWNCCWPGILSWNHSFWTCVCFVSKVRPHSFFFFFNKVKVRPHSWSAYSLGLWSTYPEFLGYLPFELPISVFRNLWIIEWLN